MSKYSYEHPVLKILSLCSSPKVKYRVSHPYKTAGKVANRSFKIAADFKLRAAFI
jgi:hypothetical protein